MIELTLYPKVVKLKLLYSGKIPKLFNPKCTDRSCTERGINLFFGESYLL